MKRVSLSFCSSREWGGAGVALVERNHMRFMYLFGMEDGGNCIYIYI